MSTKRAVAEDPNYEFARELVHDAEREIFRADAGAPEPKRARTGQPRHLLRHPLLRWIVHRHRSQTTK